LVVLGNEFDVTGLRASTMNIPQCADVAQSHCLNDWL
jgi:hypothetical protein